MQVRIEKIIYPGRSMAKKDGKVVFTDHGLPGELVEIEYIREKNKYSEAKTTKILEASPHKILPRCPHYAICSPYQNISYDYQLELKKSQIKELFIHNLKIDISGVSIKTTGNIWHYRNKVSIKIRWDGSDPYLAYNKPKKRSMFEKITECFLAPEKTNRLLASLLVLIKGHKMDFITEAEVRQSFTDGKMLLNLYINAIPNNTLLEKQLAVLTEEFPIAGITSFLKDKNNKILKGYPLFGDSIISETVCGITYNMGPLSFFQINTDALSQLIADLTKSLNKAGGETIADLYCGIGTFGLSLANKAGHVFGIDSSRDNIQFLKQNLQINKIHNFTPILSQSEKWLLHRPDKRIDILLVDPPRKGLSKNMCEAILDRMPKTVVYISCDPATLTRDLKLLLHKYNVHETIIYDFFPNTSHIETCCILCNSGQFCNSVQFWGQNT